MKSNSGYILFIVLLSFLKYLWFEIGLIVLWLFEFFCEFLDVFKFKFINKYINIILVDLLIVYLVVIGFYGFIRLKFRYFYLFLMEIKR